MNMENSIITSVGVSDKVSTLESGVGLGLKLQSTESFPFKIMSRHQDHHRPCLLSSSEPVVVVGGGGGGGGPASYSGAKEVFGCRSMNDIYHDDVAAASSGGAVGRTLQPFDISTTVTATTHTTFKSPGGMAATLGFPFTSAQWKELERQAMIYKYMMAYVPVPPDLLLPINRNIFAESQSHAHLGNGPSTFNLRFSSNKDPEPGRCKRTDGKKWRCSRDVAPQQKYCERHMHRGRPRSRKHVEAHAPFNNSSSNIINTTATKKTRLHQHPLPTTPTTLSNPTFHSSPPILGSTIQSNHTPLLLDDSTHQNLSVSSYKEHSRGLDWMMEGELVTMDTSEQQWQHLMHTNIGLTTWGSIYNNGTNFFRQDFRDEPLNLISYTDFGAPEANQQSNECALFLNPDLVSLEKETQEIPRGFIDAWSNDNANTINSDNKNESTVSSECNLSASSLTLSMAMAAGNALDEEMGQIQMGLGVKDADHNYGMGGNDKPQGSSWLSPVSWVPSTPGGPLAEVLRPSSVGVGWSPADSICAPATRVSSPTGVLQRTMLSLSDSSDCNSPTLVASTTPPEITAFQWPS
ncbi:hypothetical protein F0562_026780 [Nyssa sinensis]|uniref:Growth-regulating factor n=1 Tax=Nyssa sinensis TaxID=561372 RepID=A0A5J5BBQ7_9ASTE|nr:hypothetical protein F0562_026780 [Nyssa sinensis]